MECELCGKHIESYYIVEIEGAQIKVCSECKKYGKVISFSENKNIKESNPKNQKLKQKRYAKPAGINGNEPEIITNYGEVIKKAREKIGLTQKQFAKLINEKESLIHKIEIEEIEPDDKTIKKIERALNIKIITKNPNYNYSINTENTHSVLTLGDIIKDMMKTKKK